MTDRPTSPPAAPHDPDIDDGIDLRELIGIVLAGWPYIVVATVLGIAAAVGYLFITAPTYVTDALVQVENNQNSARIAFAQTADSVLSEVPVAAEIEILRSRLVLGKVVDKLGLDIAAIPLRLPYLGAAFARRHAGEGFATAPPLLALFNRSEYSWGGERITVTSLQVPAAMVGAPLFILAQADGQFSIVDADYQPLISGTVGQRLTTQVNGETLSIFVQELVAAPGKVFMVRKVRRESAIGRVQSNLVATASRSAEGIVTLRYQGGDPQQITRVLTEILNVYQSQNIDRRSAEAEQTLDFLSQQLPELRKEVETAEARLNQFKVAQGTADLTQETAAVLTRSVELEQAKAALVQERTEALQRFTVNHPVIESLDSQIAQLNAQIGRITERVRKLPDIEQKALQLSRDLEVSTALYISLLNRTQELEVVKSGTIGSIRIIDLPVKPVWPSAKAGVAIRPQPLEVSHHRPAGRPGAGHRYRLSHPPAAQRRG
ncbi:Wzz/FepE/Etk N-terminal domain-containing protein [Flagellatimonas centrodinii]|uniref:Wzz/FepE/Etk N-terminal domain-containing protein n=1 Tax=Flagellatimonas centrodinii TaxID=2806210 RepID=UPI001EFBADD9|nr:Wzz/FepE/Etk N-terminal domain-containing protein [Flagellatimonas centrodinii]ULQ46693.1 Wzz/FepE/Etk N-terminal domain-containing protein [Flagellatimonas centrodinii]